MENTYSLHALPLNFDVETDLEAAVYGSSDFEKREKDTFISALKRYVGERKVRNNQLAVMTGIDKGEISRYLNGERRVNKEHLCLICIALRLMTCQQKYLFDLAKEPMPCSIGKPDKWEYIIKHCMDGCYYNADYTVDYYYARLKAARLPLPTLLTSKQEGSK